MEYQMVLLSKHGSGNQLSISIQRLKHMYGICTYMHVSLIHIKNNSGIIRSSNTKKISEVHGYKNDEES